MRSFLKVLGLGAAVGLLCFCGAGPHLRHAIKGLRGPRVAKLSQAEQVIKGVVRVTVFSAPPGRKSLG